MRIALITENFLPKLDGVTRTLAMLLEHLERRGDRALVLGPPTAPSRYAGARILRAPGVPLPFYPELHLLFPPPAFERMLVHFRPEIVHVVDPMALGAAGITWAERMDAPLISSYHTNLARYCAHFHLGLLEGPVWAYRRMLHNRCDAALCPSLSTLLQLRARGFARLGVWGRGVDAGLFCSARRSAAWRAAVAGESARSIPLYVGRLSYEKNLDLLARVFVELTQGADRAGSDAHLVVIGDGPARQHLERMLAGASVTFMGYVRETELATAYASADVFAFPSVTETFGQVVLEAMASGLPVVACDAEGVCDLVEHGASGLLVAPGATNEFTEALRMLIRLPERRRELGLCARQLADRRTWSHVLDDLVTHYGLAIERRRMLTAA